MGGAGRPWRRWQRFFWPSTYAAPNGAGGAWRRFPERRHAHRLGLHRCGHLRRCRVFRRRDLAADPRSRRQASAAPSSPASAFSDTIELASGGGAGTITGLGSSVTNFGTIQFDSGATWFVAGDSAGVAAGQTINGFASGDTIELTSFVSTGHIFNVQGSRPYGGGTSETIGIQGTLAATTSRHQRRHQQLRRTRSLLLCRHTDRHAEWQRAVESLAAGDVVLTASGTERAIAWLGVGRVLATPSRRNAATR